MTSITNGRIRYPAAHDPGYYEEPGVETAYAPSAPTDLSAGIVGRSPWLPLPFVVPTALCGASGVGGGVQVLTDLGFTMLAVICAVYCVRELTVFRHRFGLGGLLCFGGALVWWCHDYFSRWFGNAHGT